MRALVPSTLIRLFLKGIGGSDDVERQDTVEIRGTEKSSNQIRLEPTFLGFAALLVDIAKGVHKGGSNGLDAQHGSSVPNSTDQDSILRFGTK